MKRKSSVAEKLEYGSTTIDSPVEDSSRKHKRKREGKGADQQVATDDNTAKDRKKRRKEEPEDGKKDKKMPKAKDVMAQVHEESVISDLNDAKKASDVGDGKQKRRKSHSQLSEHDSERKKKKSKKKAIENSGETLDEEVVIETPKSKKTRKVAGNPDAENAEPQKKSKRKQKHVAVEDDVVEMSGHASRQEVEEKSHKKKKRKHKEADDPTPGTLEHSEPLASHKKKKKRSSHKHSEFPDPSGDSTLSDSARKALQYVHARVTSQPDWKFNKARQNWVLRNIWDDATLPETYFPSCIKYLAGVQGNTRDLLVKLSTELIETPPKPEAKATSSDGAPAQSQDAKPEAEGVAAELSEEQERKRTLNISRARALLATLETGVEKSS